MKRTIDLMSWRFSRAKEKKNLLLHQYPAAAVNAQRLNVDYRAIGVFNEVLRKDSLGSGPGPVTDGLPERPVTGAPL